MIRSDTWGFSLGLRSDVGVVRAVNEDSGYGDGSMAFIADGVGGGPCGATASSLVVTTLVEHFSQGSSSDDDARAGFVAANNALRSWMNHEPASRGMATTLTGIIRHGTKITMCHVGDSRLYRVRGHDLIQVSRDDSWIQLLLDQGQINDDEAKTHPLRSMLLNSLAGGLNDAADVYVTSLDARLGDRWVLATDGVTDYCDPDVLTHYCVSATDPQQAADQLINATLPYSRDNLSVIIADVVSIPDSSGTIIGAAAEAGVFRQQVG